MNTRREKMDKKQSVFIIFITTLVLLIGGCSDTATPEEAFESYISHWTQGEFDLMYEITSSDSKKYISKEDFVARYENIYEGIKAENVSITFSEEEAKEEEHNKNIPYTLTMDTLAGPIELGHNAKFILEEGQEEEKWVLQWDESMLFPQMEKGDSVRVETISSKRGEIYDRNGIALAVNGEVQMIGIIPKDLGETEIKVKERLAKEFQMTVEDVDRKLGATWVEPDLFVPMKALPMDEEDKIKQLTSLPGVVAQAQPSRVYPQKEIAAHLVGYIGSIPQEDLEKLKENDYHQDSVIGKAGLEQIYEEQLRGIDGKSIHIVDQHNTRKETLVKKEVHNGQDIELTIDSTLQKNIFEKMKEEKGTAVALHPQTGEVLAMVNAPSYDPNEFVLGISPKQWSNLNEDAKQPLLNRFSQTYSPGSVFKPIIAAIGVDTGAIDPNKALDISGLQWQKDSSWGDYSVTRVSDPGKPVNLKEALVYSDNIYFAKTALEIGKETFEEETKKFGVGEKVPFEYPIKSSQIANKNSISGDIQLADSGYGQGEVALSPLYLTTIYTSFLNKGSVIQPTLIKKSGGEKQQYWKENVTSKETANRIKENLIQVIEDPQGTGKAGKIEGVTLGGKTGTAELKTSQGEEGQENGWFVVFDGEDSQIILTMMLEDVSGGSYVIPKAKAVLEEYL